MRKIVPMKRNSDLNDKIEDLAIMSRAALRSIIKKIPPGYELETLEPDGNTGMFKVKLRPIGMVYCAIRTESVPRDHRGKFSKEH